MGKICISHWRAAGSQLTAKTLQGDMHINHVYDSNHYLFDYAMEIVGLLDAILLKQKS